MKTNITMISEKDRELFGVIIRQNTENSMLSLTDLQEAYTRARILNNWKVKDIFHILGYEENAERIFYILKEQNVIDDKTTLTSFYEKVQNNGIIKVLKEIGAYKTTGRGENKQSICNPYIWVLVAMELNPQLYAKVVTWLTDKLILNRIEAGNFYIPLTKALNEKIENPDYSRIAIELNKKVFGKHEFGIRNKASAEELKALTRIEDNVAFGIRKGFYKDNAAVIDAIKTY